MQDLTRLSLAKRAVGDKVPVNDFVSTAPFPRRSIATPLVPLMTGFHRWILQRAYEVVTAAPEVTVNGSTPKRDR